VAAVLDEEWVAVEVVSARLELVWQKQDGTLGEAPVGVVVKWGAAATGATAEDITLRSRGRHILPPPLGHKLAFFDAAGGAFDLGEVKAVWRDKRSGAIVKLTKATRTRVEFHNTRTGAVSQTDPNAVAPRAAAPAADANAADDVPRSACGAWCSKYMRKCKCKCKRKATANADANAAKHFHNPLNTVQALAALAGSARERVQQRGAGRGDPTDTVLEMTDLAALVRPGSAAAPGAELAAPIVQGAAESGGDSGSGDDIISNLDVAATSDHVEDEQLGGAEIAQLRAEVENMKQDHEREITKLRAENEQLKQAQPGGAMSPGAMGLELSGEHDLKIGRAHV
jgi:hypothetical protein